MNQSEGCEGRSNDAVHLARKKNTAQQRKQIKKSKTPGGKESLKGRKDTEGR